MDALPRALEGLAQASLERETRDLDLLRECGFPVAPVVVVPARAEAQFYELNNLAERLERLFAGIDLSDPDDEDIEDLAPEAHALVAGHYLLDEFIDAFYEATAGLPALVRVRRPGEPGLSGGRGRRSLLLLKALWTASWTFEAVWERLSGGGTLLPRARPVLVHAAAHEPLPLGLSRDAEAVLGVPVTLYGGSAGITGVGRPRR